MINNVWITPYIKDLNIERQILKEFKVSQNDFNLVDAIGAIIWHEKFPIDFQNFRKIKAISRFGAGLDNIDLQFCFDNNIRVCNVPDYGVDEVSDTAIGFLLWLSRGLGKYNYDSLNLTDGSWETNIKENIRRTNKLKLGIVGLGRIGSKVALKAKSLGFLVKGYDPNQIAGHEKILGIERKRNLYEMISECDFISLNCDLNKDNYNLVDEKFINCMKPNACLINTARGTLVKSIEFILDCVEDEKIGGFASDVLPKEPPNILIQQRIKNSPKLSQNIILTPHTAFYSMDAFAEMRTKAAKNLYFMIKENPLLESEKEIKLNFNRFKII